MCFLVLLSSLGVSPDSHTPKAHFRSCSCWLHVGICMYTCNYLADTRISEERAQEPRVGESAALPIIYYKLIIR